MRTLFFILTFIFSLNSFAQTKPDITIVDPDLDAKELENTFDVHKGSTHKSSLPDKEARDELLSAIKPAKKWDELKKDIFFMDLKSKDLAELKEKYPELSITELKKLKEKR